MFLHDKLVIAFHKSMDELMCFVRILGLIALRRMVFITVSISSDDGAKFKYSSNVARKKFKYA